MDQPTFWISTLLFILFWLILQGVLVYIYKDFISVSSKIQIGDKVIIGGPVNILSVRDRVWTPSHKYLNAPFLISHILGFIHLCFLVHIFLVPSDYKMSYFSFIPYLENVFLAFQHFEKNPTKSTVDNILNITRGYLPPGRKWLCPKSPRAGFCGSSASPPQRSPWAGAKSNGPVHQRAVPALHKTGRTP